MPLSTPPRKPVRITSFEKFKNDPDAQPENHVPTSFWVPFSFPSGINERSSTKSVRDIKFDACAYLDPNTPLVLSSSATGSTSTSPAEDNDVWESPLSYQAQGKFVFKSSVTTPSTPSTPPDKTLTNLSKCVLESVLKSKCSKLDGAKTVVDGSQGEAEVLKELNFKPVPLLRNLTKDFQAIKNESHVSAMCSFNPIPSFEFDIAPKTTRSGRLYCPRSTTKQEVSVRETEPHISEQVAAESKPTSRLQSKTKSASKESLQTILEHILPITFQYRLAYKPEKCVASLVKKANQRCNFKRAGGDVNKLCRDLSRYKLNKHAPDILGCLEELVRAAACEIHRKSAMSQKRWPKLEELVLGRNVILPKERAEIETWIEKIIHGEIVLHADCEDEDLSHETATRRTKPSPKLPQRLPQTTTRANPDQSLPQKVHNFQPYQPKNTQNCTVSAALLSKTVKPLNSTDLDSGFIYMFWEPGNFGKIKIGRTKDLSQRLQGWNRRCGREHAYLPAISRSELPEIPHVSRIEHLIHTELKEYRRKAWCENCRQWHQEWFEVEDKVVVQVFEKWRKWIEQTPYEPDERTGRWVLRKDMMGSVAEVCMPVVWEVQEEPRRRSTRLEESKRRSP